MKREIVTILIASPLFIIVGGILFFSGNISFIICAFMSFIAHAYIISWPLIRTFFNSKRIIGPEALSNVQALITDNFTYELFKQFAFREFSVENPIFLKELREFKYKFEHTDSRESQEQLVLQIFHTFLIRGATLELNVEHPLIIILENQIAQKQFTINMFDNIETSVLAMIQSDTWRRWTLSSEYKKIAFELDQSRKFNII